MQQPKPITKPKPTTITGQLFPGRDDRAIEFVAQPHVNTSEVIRQAIPLYLDHLDCLDNLADISANILDALNRIEKALKGGHGSPSPDKPKPKSDNLFLNSSP